MRKYEAKFGLYGPLSTGGYWCVRGLFTLGELVAAWNRIQSGELSGWQIRQQ